MDRENGSPEKAEVEGEESSGNAISKYWGF